MYTKKEIGKVRGFPVWIALVSILLFFSCCPLEEGDFEFDEEHKALLAPYEKGDTLYFENQEGTDMDTFFISGIDTIKECGAGPLSAFPYKYISIKIKHLPKNKWTGGSYEMTTTGESGTYDQGLISITKDSIESKEPNYFIVFGYRDFEESNDSLFMKKEGELFNYYGIKEYIKVMALKRSYKEIKRGDVNVIYWTKKYGLTAYSKKGEGLYKVVPERSY